jgi:hypothetical protein
VRMLADTVSPAPGGIAGLVTAIGVAIGAVMTAGALVIQALRRQPATPAAPAPPPLEVTTGSLPLELGEYYRAELERARTDAHRGFQERDMWMERAYEAGWREP